MKVETPRAEYLPEFRELKVAELILSWKKLALLIIGFTVFAGAYFGPSAYRKAQMDKEVDRLCAVDGGIKVFERVSLSSDKFDQSGNAVIPLATSKNSSASAFVLDSDIEEITKSDLSRNGMPTLHRFTNRVIRTADKKIFGEAVGYYRSGGDPDGLWHSSHYIGCTEGSGKKLIRTVSFKIN